MDDELNFVTCEQALSVRSASVNALLLFLLLIISSQIEKTLN